MNEKGALPTRDHYTGNFEGADEISGQAMAKSILTKTRGCFCCTIHCTRVINIPYGPYKGTRGKGPDYDSMVAFGSQCGNSNLEAAARANMWCDQYGLDTVSTGATIAWAMELYEHGIINDDDTHGVKLNWGDHEAMTSMVPKIATRSEFGAVLPSGPDKGSVVHLERMLDEYYEARGWDKTTGWPTSEKLAALGLDYVAKDLEKAEPALRQATA